MRDFLGNKLELNDEVVFIAPFYRSLAKGKIIKFTPKKILIEYSNNWNYKEGMLCTLYQEPFQVVKNLAESIGMPVSLIS